MIRKWQNQGVILQDALGRFVKTLKSEGPILSNNGNIKEWPNPIISKNGDGIFPLRAAKPRVGK